MTSRLSVPITNLIPLFLLAFFFTFHIIKFHWNVHTILIIIKVWNDSHLKWLCSKYVQKKKMKKKWTSLPLVLGDTCMKGILWYGDMLSTLITSLTCHRFLNKYSVLFVWTKQKNFSFMHIFFPLATVKSQRRRWNERKTNHERNGKWETPAKESKK